DVVLGDEEVGPAVSVGVEEAQVGIVEVDLGPGREGDEGPPPPLRGALLVAWAGGVEADEVLAPVAGEVHHLLAPAAEAGHRGPRGDHLDGPEEAVAAVALVEPGAGLLREHPREPLAVEVEPLVVRAVEADREVLDALALDVAHLVVDPWR